MSFFNFFKKKKKMPTYSEKLNLAYQCYNPDLVGMIFPGGKEQAEKVIVSLGKIYDVDLETSNAERYFDILSTYSDVVVRLDITQSTDDSIIESLQTNHSDLVKNKEIAKKALKFIKMNVDDNDYVFNDDEYDDDPNYGLTVSKPIYTHGVIGSDIYLQSLKAITDEPLTWRRLGSISVQGIDGIIDIYESNLPSGEPYLKLYLNMYGSSNSKKIPRGFKKA